MALVTANGQNAFDTQIFTPRVGAWHVDLRVDDPDAIVGQVTVTVDGAFSLVGTAVRTGEFVETAQLRVVAGAGGLGLSAAPRHYNATSLGGVLRDLLVGAGEKLSSTADPAVLGLELASWTTIGLPVGAVIAALLAAHAPAAAWRMLPDGTCWAGNETWPAATVDATTYAITDRAYEDATVLLAVEVPFLLAGTTFEGGRVSYVQMDVPHVESVVMRVWFEDATPTQMGRMVDDFAAMVRAVPAPIDYRARYSGTVVVQSGNTVDVAFDDPRLDSMGGVELLGAAGDSVDGVLGGRVLVGWRGVDLKPYAEGFDSDANPTTRTIAAGAALFLGGKALAEPAPLGAQLMLYLTAIATAINGLAPGFPPPPPTILSTKVSVSP